MSVSASLQYGYVAPVAWPFDEAVQKTEDALKNEGFGVLCHIDIQAKMREKLNVEFPRYVILGVCNPPLAHQALQWEIHLGLLLPCNAVVYESGGQVFIGVVDAAKMLSVVGNAAMQPLAEKVNQSLRRAVDAVVGR